MRTFLAFLLALGISFAAVSSSPCAQPRTVTITIENRTSLFEVSPSIEVFGLPPEDFTKRSQTTYEYIFPVPENEWFNTVDIRLVWKDAYSRNDGTKTDFEQRILLRIRRDFPSQFRVPVYFSNNRSNAEMTRLENERDANQQFEKFFRAYQIASYYRDTFGPQHPVTKRATNIVFYAAVKLAETPNYFVVMSDDAEQFAKDAFGTSSTYSDRANVARAVYWADLRQVDAYAAKGDCGTATLILAAFQQLKSDDPRGFEAQYGKDPTILDEKAKIVRAKCDVARNAQSDTVYVEYRGEVPINRFDCTDVDRSSFVKRICYDRLNQYMLIDLNKRYYHYCEIDEATVLGLLQADSVGHFYEASVKGRFDCRTHRIPNY